MPRRPRPAKTQRSEHWLRVMVNESPKVLDIAIASAFGWPATGIDWRSPRQDDDYAEYYDDAFLERLGVVKLTMLRNFTENGRVVRGKTATSRSEATLDFFLCL
ncbi:MAG: hypothetical protein EOM37_11775 [Proteobacteria bacterium]|nr:hypothetical protein [Pseudomonadota bacterium]